MYVKESSEPQCRMGCPLTSGLSWSTTNVIVIPSRLNPFIPCVIWRDRYTYTSSFAVRWMHFSFLQDVPRRLHSFSTILCQVPLGRPSVAHLGRVNSTACRSQQCSCSPFLFRQLSTTTFASWLPTGYSHQEHRVWNSMRPVYFDGRSQKSVGVAFELSSDKGVHFFICYPYIATQNSLHSLLTLSKAFSKSMKS